MPGIPGIPGIPPGPPGAAPGVPPGVCRRAGGWGRVYCHTRRLSAGVLWSVLSATNRRGPLRKTTLSPWTDGDEVIGCRAPCFGYRQMALPLPAFRQYREPSALPRKIMRSLSAGRPATMP